MGLCCSTSSTFSSSDSEVGDEEFFLSALNKNVISTFHCASFHREALKKSHSESCLSFENSKDELESKDSVEFHDLMTLRYYIQYLLFDEAFDFIKVYGKQRKFEFEEYDKILYIIHGYPVKCDDQSTQTTLKNCCQVNQEKTKRRNSMTNNVEDAYNTIFCVDVQNQNFLTENALSTDQIVHPQYDDQKESDPNDAHLPLRNKLNEKIDNNFQIEYEECIIPNKSEKLYDDTKSKDLYPEKEKYYLKDRFSSFTGQFENEYNNKCENIKLQNHDTIDSIVYEYKSMLNDSKNQVNCFNKSTQTEKMNQGLENECEGNLSTGNNYYNDMDLNDKIYNEHHEPVRENNVKEPHDNQMESSLFWTNKIIAVDRNGICFGLPGLVQANLGKENGISLFGQKIL